MQYILQYLKLRLNFGLYKAIIFRSRFIQNFYFVCKRERGIERLEAIACSFEGTQTCGQHLHHAWMIQLCIARCPSNEEYKLVWGNLAGIFRCQGAGEGACPGPRTAVHGAKEELKN